MEIPMKTRAKKAPVGETGQSDDAVIDSDQDEINTDQEHINGSADQDEIEIDDQELIDNLVEKIDGLNEKTNPKDVKLILESMASIGLADYQEAGYCGKIAKAIGSTKSDIVASYKKIKAVKARARKSTNNSSNSPCSASIKTKCYFENVDNECRYIIYDLAGNELDYTAVIARALEFVKMYIPDKHQLAIDTAIPPYQVKIGEEKLDLDIDNIFVHIKKQGLIRNHRFVKDAIDNMLASAVKSGIATDYYFGYPCITIDYAKNFKLVLPQTDKIIGSNDTQKNFLAALETKELATDHGYLTKFHEIFLLGHKEYPARFFKNIVIGGYTTISPIFHPLRVSGGHDLFPDLTLIGDKETGKSKTAEFYALLFGIEGSESADSIDSRFRLLFQLSESGFPRVLDDIDKLDEKLFGILKGTRTGINEDKRGNKDKTMSNYPQEEPFITTSNNTQWVKNQEAYLSRAPVLYFDENDRLYVVDNKERFEDIKMELIQDKKIYANLFYEDAFKIIDSWYPAGNQLEKFERKLKETKIGLKKELDDLGFNKIDGRHVEFWAYIKMALLTWIGVFKNHDIDTTEFDEILARYAREVKMSEIMSRKADIEAIEAIYSHFTDAIASARENTKSCNVKDTKFDTIKTIIDGKTTGSIYAQVKDMQYKRFDREGKEQEEHLMLIYKLDDGTGTIDLVVYDQMAEGQLNSRYGIKIDDYINVYNIRKADYQGNPVLKETKNTHVERPDTINDGIEIEIEDNNDTAFIEACRKTGIYPYKNEYFITFKFIEDYNKAIGNNKDQRFPNLTAYKKLQNAVLGMDDEACSQWVGVKSNIYCFIFRVDKLAMFKKDKGDPA